MNLDKIDMRQLELLAQGKHTDTFMATFFEVKLGDWKKWKEDNPEIETKMREWRAVPKAIGEAALFSLVDGTAETVEITLEATGEYEFLRDVMTREVMESFPEYRKRVKITRHAPSINAIKFFLNNVAPDEWRERVEVTDENKDKMAKLILEATRRSTKFDAQRQLEGVAKN